VSNRASETKKRLDKIIGKNIRREREVRRFRRDEFAKILDLTPSHLGLIERGVRGATPATLEKVVQSLNVSIDGLFSETGRAKSARERHNANSGAYFQKVSTLMNLLAEHELQLIAHTIEGLMAMRKTEDMPETMILR